MQYYIFSPKSREPISGPYNSERVATSMIPSVAQYADVDKDTLYVANGSKKKDKSFPKVKIHPKPIHESIDFARKAKEMGVEYIPPLPEPKKVETNPVVAICGQCGRECRKVEMFSCPDSRCPVQKKGKL